MAVPTDTKVTIDPRLIDAVLFDLDGVVTDTASVHEAAWAELFDEFFRHRAAQYGEEHRPFSHEDYRRHLDGRPRRDGISTFLAARGITLPQGRIGDEGHDSIAGLEARKQQAFTRHLASGLDVIEPAATLVAALTAADVKTAVCSSSRNCRAVLRAARLTESFDTVLDGTDAERLGLRPKPAADLFLAAAERLDVRPERCVVIEDARVGVAAGCAGGFATVIGVGAKEVADDLRAHGADSVVPDLTPVVVGSTHRRSSELPSADGAVVIGILGSRAPMVSCHLGGLQAEATGQSVVAAAHVELANALQRLAAHCSVAVVGDYDAADLRAHYDIPGAWYAGYGGLELVAPNGDRQEHELVATAASSLRSAAEQLDSQLLHTAGMHLECNRFRIVVHHPTAPAELAALRSIVHAAAAAHGLRVVRGSDSTELRPDLGWDRGAAVNLIAERAGGTPRRLLFVGTDGADESAFDVVGHRGVGVVVRSAESNDRRTAAEYAVAGTRGVTELFDSLASTLEHREAGPWSVTFEGYRPEDVGLREVLCAVGNGYLGSRGCGPESRADGTHYPGTYVAGIFDRATDLVDDVTVEHESMVNLPNWLSVQLRVEGGPWFDPDSAELLQYRQTMRLDVAEHVREYRFRDIAGRITMVTERRFASMRDKHICALQLTVNPENWSGRLEFCSLVDGGVTNSGIERDRILDGRHLDPPAFQHTSPDTVLCTTYTAHSHVPIAVAARTTVWDIATDAPIAANYLRIDRNSSAGAHITVEVTANRSVSVEKVSAIFTGRDPAIGAPAEAASGALARHPRYAELFDAHRVAWMHLWEAFDLEVGEDVDVQRVLRLHICHLLQSISPHVEDVDAGVPEGGLYGEADRGHVFWDELSVIPVLTLRLPGLVRALLAYRHRRLPEARRSAAAAGYAGAMFPLQSGSDGREECPQTHQKPRMGHRTPDASPRAVHAGSAVAYNIWQYYQATGDLDFMIDCGAEDLVEIARFWASRCRFDDLRRRYVIERVIGPDEFHTGYHDDPYGGVDNNAYTNVMAVWVIQRAAEALAELPLRARVQLVETLGLGADEFEHWDRITKQMYVPFHDGIISQFDGYAELRELDWQGYRSRYRDIGRLDRILEAEHDSVTRYQVTQQADVLMLFYLLSADELRELFARLGYPFTGVQLTRTIDYYLGRTSHGSTLSAVVHSWVLLRGNRAKAEDCFREVLCVDVDDRQRGMTAEGIHLGAMAASIDLVQRCILGLETRGNRLVVGPMWPESSDPLGFSLVYRGLHLTVRISGRTAELIAEPGGAPPIVVECRGLRQQLAPGGRISVG